MSADTKNDKKNVKPATWQDNLHNQEGLCQANQNSCPNKASFRVKTPEGQKLLLCGTHARPWTKPRGIVEELPKPSRREVRVIYRGMGGHD